MSISAWRITPEKHADTAFTGEGARLFGGRWNSPGFAAVYASHHVSLAILETLVRLPSPELLGSYVVFNLTFDEALVENVDADSLSLNWRASPPPLDVQQIGDRWLKEQRSVVLRTPSVIVPHEWNYILNPLHPGFGSIKIGPAQPITFDKRLFKKPIE